MKGHFQPTRKSRFLIQFNNQENLILYNLTGRFSLVRQGVDGSRVKGEIRSHGAATVISPRLSVIGGQAPLVS